MDDRVRLIKQRVQTRKALGWCPPEFVVETPCSSQWESDLSGVVPEESMRHVSTVGVHESERYAEGENARIADRLREYDRLRNEYLIRQIKKENGRWTSPSERLVEKNE